MKKEERIISSMFEAAREEVPQVSFEDMAQQFSKQVPAVAGAEQGSLGAIKNLLLKHISLNSLLLFSIGSMALLSITLTSRENEEVSVYELQKTEVVNEEKIASEMPQTAPDQLAPVEPLEQSTEQERPVKVEKSTMPSPAQDNVISLSPPDNRPSSDTPLSPAEMENSLGLSPELGMENVNPDLMPVNEAEKPESMINAGTVSVGDTLKSPETPKNVLVDERGKIRDQKKVRKIDVNGTVTLTLLNNYNHDMADQFLTQLKSYGLTIKKDRYRFRKGHIRNLFLQITHHQGLDFKLRAAKFKRLDFKLYFDQRDALVGFSYHFNHDRAKTEIISLKARGSITQQY